MTSKNLTTSSLSLPASSLQYKPRSEAVLPHLPPRGSGRFVTSCPQEILGQGSLIGFFLIYLSGCIVGGFVHLLLKIPYTDCKTFSKQCQALDVSDFKEKYF